MIGRFAFHFCRIHHDVISSAAVIVKGLVRRLPERVQHQLLGSTEAAGGGPIATITRGHTGRKSSGTVETILANQWSSGESSLSLYCHEGAGHFFALLKGVRPIVGQRFVMFRGRPERENIKGWEDMGPPSKSKTPDGRYNRRRHPVLYLCDSADGVRCEMGGGRLCLQEYELPLGKVRIVDLSVPELPNYLHFVFDIAERAKVEGRSGLNTYRFGQVLAELVREAGFNGMKVPGVRGDSSLYSNVVVFGPGKWREWSRREQGFSVLIS